MNRKQGLHAAGGVLLLVLGTLLIYASSLGFRERRYVAETGPCRVAINVVQKAGLPDTAEAGSVVLFHGLAANKTIMNYLAHAFADQGLRVFVPDLPGHGRSAGPFSPNQAEACSLAIVRGLAARGLIVPDKTILAGHSMGGAIALRIAPRIRPAGVIAISPAPMQTAHGVSQENLLYSGTPPVVPNTLILVGQFEPQWLAANAQDLAATSSDTTAEFIRVPYNSHVSVLFSPAVAAQCQAWAARVLHLPQADRLPNRANLFGALLGLGGILLLAGPFLSEALGKKPQEEVSPAKVPSAWRTVVEFAAVSLAIVAVLRYWVPLRLLPLFEGNYLASFFLLAGIVLLLLHPKLAQSQFAAKRGILLGAVFAGFLLHLLITGWLELSVTSAWLSLQRWTRFPVFFLGAFLFLYALEAMLGPATAERAAQRVVFSLLLLAIAWLALSVGVFYLRSSEILLVLMSPYFALFFILYRIGAQSVRRLSGSTAATAVFGAILLTGVCLVLFPVS